MVLRPELNDDDVVSESSRIESGDTRDDVIVIKNLSRKFGAKYAVENVSLGIPAGQCFGLLGFNGAGKSTCFKMLTGELAITDGTAQVIYFLYRMLLNNHMAH